MRHLGYIDLPPNQGTGGFDHAAIHAGSDKLYVAHTSNNAIDIVDTRLNRFLHSIQNLPRVAGVLVSNEQDLIFSSNRGENTVAVFSQRDEARIDKVRVGGLPNGLAYDHSRSRLLVANVSRPDGSEPASVSMVDVAKRTMTSDFSVPGRTRWTVFDEKASRFYVNVAKPPQILAFDSREPHRIDHSYPIPATGPHGLDIDLGRRRLYCACDEGGLYTLGLESGAVSKVSDLDGAPDVIFYNARLDHLYVTIGNPGVIQVVDVGSMKTVQTVKTELGTHTIAFDRKTNRVYAFMPESHRASIFIDG